MTTTAHKQRPRVARWKRELHNGDEIRIDMGQAMPLRSIPTVIIQAIEWTGNVARILTKDGERVECLAEEIS